MRCVRISAVLLAIIAVSFVSGCKLLTNWVPPFPTSTSTATADTVHADSGAALGKQYMLSDFMPETVAKLDSNDLLACARPGTTLKFTVVSSDSNIVRLLPEQSVSQELHESLRPLCDGLDPIGFRARFYTVGLGTSKLTYSTWSSALTASRDTAFFVESK